MNLLLTGKLRVVICTIILLSICPVSGFAQEKETLKGLTHQNFGTDDTKGTAWRYQAMSEYGECGNNGSSAVKDDLPRWIKEMIAREEAGMTANPPASLFRCVYGKRVVYYQPPGCCDMFGFLWDENGNFICSPDGGLKGGGDGKCPDFHDVKKDCTIIWRGSRSFQ